MIAFERRGGFAGTTLRSSVAEGELSDEERDTLSALLAAPPQTGPGRPDRFEYHLRTPDGHLVLPEGAVPEALRGLLARLVQRARPGR